MSPRSTQALHEGRNIQHLPAIRLIGFECCNLVGQGLAPPHARSAVEDCAADRLRPAQPGSLELAQRLGCFIIQAHANRHLHEPSVSHNVIQGPGLRQPALMQVAGWALVRE